MTSHNDSGRGGSTRPQPPPQQPPPTAEESYEEMSERPGLEKFVYKGNSVTLSPRFENWLELFDLAVLLNGGTKRKDDYNTIRAMLTAHLKPNRVVFKEVATRKNLEKPRRGVGHIAEDDGESVNVMRHNQHYNGPPQQRRHDDSNRRQSQPAQVSQRPASQPNQQTCGNCGRPRH